MFYQMKGGSGRSISNGGGERVVFNERFVGTTTGELAREELLSSSGFSG